MGFLLKQNRKIPQFCLDLVCYAILFGVLALSYQHSWNMHRVSKNLERDSPNIGAFFL